MDINAAINRSQATRLALADILAVQAHEADRSAQLLDHLTAAQERDRGTADTFSSAISVLNRVVEVSCTANLRKLEEFVNLALRRVFLDQDLEFRVVTEVKRGMTVHRLEVLHDGLPCKLRSLGGAIWAVIALILRVLMARFAKRSSVQILDEQLKFVSEQYVARVVQFLIELGHDLGVKFLVVTHDQAFASASACNYHAVQATGSTTRFDFDSPAAAPRTASLRQP